MGLVAAHRATLGKAIQAVQKRGRWSAHSKAILPVALTVRAASTGVALSANLTDGISADRSAAFNGYHVSGADPAGNARLTDAASVADRFQIAMMRRPAAAA